MICEQSRRWVCGLLALLLAGTASADTAPAQPYQPPVAVTEALRIWEALQVEVKAYFPGPGNLVGVAAELGEGKGMVFYLDPTGTIMVSGVALNLATGENLTVLAGQRYLGEAPTPVPVAQDTATTPAPLELLALPAIIEGPVAADDFLFVFFDFRCPHCERFYEIVQTLMARTNLSVHWIPLNFGGDLSDTLSAYALGADTDQATMRKLFQSGAGQPEGIPVDALLADPARVMRGALKLERTASYAARIGVSATPHLVHLRGGAVRVFSGGLALQGLQAWLEPN